MEMNISIASKNKRGKNKLTSLWIIVFIFLVAGFGFLWWKQDTIQKQNTLLQTSISNIKAQLYEKKGTKTLKDISESQRILTEAQKYRINWSDIMQNILVYETNGIVFDSFSISNEKNISVNAKAPNLQLVKQLIITLSGHEKIKNPFVASISEQDDSSINFQLSFQFTE